MKKSNYSSWSFPKRKIKPEGKTYQGKLQPKCSNFDGVISWCVKSSYSKKSILAVKIATYSDAIKIIFDK